MAVDRLALLLQYHAEDPHDAFTCFALAQEYAKHGNTVKACSLYESLVAMQPTYTGTYYHLGKLYLALDQRKEAAEIFRKGIAVSSQERALKDLSELQQALMELHDE